MEGLLKEMYYNSDQNLDIVFKKNVYNELPPLTGMESLQLCMKTGLVWFKLQDYILYIVITDKVRFEQ